MAPDEQMTVGPARRWAVRSAFAIVVAAQVLVCFWGIADPWVRGHNGFNGSAFHLAARNTLRWGIILPVQYYTKATPPAAAEAYTHHPLGMHLTNVASLWLFGDSEASIRLVPAVHGILAILALMILVRRLWGDGHALLAGAVYLFLPINGIYANMANHSSAFIAYSLSCFTCYAGYQRAREQGLPWKKWYAGALGLWAMAAMWDWPSYYFAFIVAVHWLCAGIARSRRSTRKWYLLGGELAPLAGFSALVLAMFGGHFGVVALIVGSVEDLGGTFQARQYMDWPYFRHHLMNAPPLMFTIPVLGMAAAWLVALPVRACRKRASIGDLACLVYAVCGLFHYGLFRWSAFAHCYWGWTLLPFVSIACAVVVIGAGRWIAGAVRRLSEGRWVRPASVVAGMCAGLLLVPLAMRSVDLVWRGRSVGGSMWFIEKVRTPIPEHYSSGRSEILFAKRVRKSTTRATGVLIHHSFGELVPESRFDTTLDREIVEVNGLPRKLPDRPGITDGWVMIGVAGAINERLLTLWASGHPLHLYDHLFLLDLRREGTEIRVHTMVARPASLAWLYFVTPFAPPVEAVRLGDVEAAMQAEVDMLHPGARPARPGKAPSS